MARKKAHKAFRRVTGGEHNTLSPKELFSILTTEFPNKVALAMIIEAKQDGTIEANSSTYKTEVLG